MNNKILVNLVIPEFDESFDIFIPISTKVGKLVELLNKNLECLSQNSQNEVNELYDINGRKYDYNKIIKETDIRNGSKVILI